MKKSIQLLTLGVLYSLFSLNSSAELPEGSYMGCSSFFDHKNCNDLIYNDAMALLIKKDPSANDKYYAVLAEYDRVPLTNITVKTALTKWVNRMYAYELTRADTGLTYLAKRLVVDDEGNIVASSEKSDLLILKNDHDLEGATFLRVDKSQEEDDIVLEKISFSGKVGSTWENLVPGDYFGSTDSTGGDYFKKTINTRVNADGTIVFNQAGLRGEYVTAEKAPGLFTFASLNTHNQSNLNLEKKIGVFIDIVNWKPLMTTDELLIIDPDDAKNVGFYYERH